ENKLKYLIRIFTSKRLFARELIRLIKFRNKVLSVAENIYSKNEEEIADFFQKEFYEYVEKILNINKPQVIEAVTEINNAVLQDKNDNDKALIAYSILQKLASEKNLQKILKFLLELKENILTKSCKVASRGYLKDKFQREILSFQISLVENYFDDFNNILTIENNYKVDLELAKFGKITLQFFSKGLKIYNDKKRESGYLDFEDILLFTQEILKNEDVRKNLIQKYKYIMVDEYQDTNEIQYQIFLPILDFLKEGNLFVVGDEKQSIYMFRDADLAVFSRTKDEIEITSGKDRILSLPDSFRMAPRLCLFTNVLFENLFSNPNDNFNEVKHSDLVCAREDDEKGKIEILIPEQDDSDDENEQNNISEADLVSKRILKLMNENKSETNLNWSDIAILCRKRKSFSELEASLIRHKIPFIIMGGKGFYQRQSIYDIYNYFSFILDIENSTALVGILRSPFFSISDSEIFEISIIKDENFWEKFVKYSSLKNKHSKIVSTLKENILLADNYSVSSLLRKILAETEYISVIASRSNSMQELANIEKLIRLTTNFNYQGFKTLYDYVDYLKDSIQQIEDESQASVTDESNSIKIMTLHQAKGLEFPAVFLFKCDETSQKNSVRSKSIIVDKNFGLLTKVPLEENYFSDYESASIVTIYDFINDKKNLAEIKRLFYVGITRAKNYLFLSASFVKEFNYKKDSFMGLLKEGLDIDFSSAQFSISYDLAYLKKDGEKYTNFIESLEIEIPVIIKIEEQILIEEENDIDISNKKILTEKIIDKPKGEIISATKVSVYKQCPLKYHLTYELGFTSLVSEYKKWERKNLRNVKERFEFNDREDNEAEQQNNPEGENGTKGFAEVKGRIIHKILQNNLNKSELENFAEAEIKDEISLLELDEQIRFSLLKEIVDNLITFYNSQTFKLINSFKNYKNEFEIYVKENDYYLYGIIDKLVIEKNEVHIIDYKTDDISTDEIPGRAESYFNQLKFYSYIVGKLFRSINKFNLQIIFIKHPEKAVIKEVQKKEFLDFSEELRNMVEDIRNKSYNKNLSHCSSCTFALNNNECVIR
ncbi:MAG: 3'-5' exonuclease, partial [Ignavibacteriaceae bacterium]